MPQILAMLVVYQPLNLFLKSESLFKSQTINLDARVLVKLTAFLKVYVFLLF